MAYLIPSLLVLLEAFRPCFRREAFHNFRTAVCAWLLCLGRRTLSEVVQAGGLPADKHHDALDHLFAHAAWEPNDVGERLAWQLIQRFAPTGRLWLVVDDTLCHKRGAKVAFGGIFLDAVLSSKRRKVFRFGVNHVVLGLAVRLPGRPDRCFCLPLRCAAFVKKDRPGHVKRTDLAARLARCLAELCPDRPLVLVGDAAYINAATLRERPANLQVVGPIHPKAALYAPAAPRPPGERGRPRKKGARLPTPRAMLEDPATYPAQTTTYDFPGGPRALRTQHVPDVLWYTAARQERLRLVLVRDPAGRWRDAACVCTDPTLTVAEVLEGSCQRWSIELTFHDCKQHLGLSDPQVRTGPSVARAHTRAYWCYSLTILWYAENPGAEAPLRERPWYPAGVGPTFTEMLGTLRLALWQGRIFGECGATTGHTISPERLDALLHFIAAVR